MVVSRSMGAAEQREGTVGVTAIEGEPGEVVNRQWPVGVQRLGVHQPLLGQFDLAELLVGLGPQPSQRWSCTPGHERLERLGEQTERSRTFGGVAGCLRKQCRGDSRLVQASQRVAHRAARLAALSALSRLSAGELMEDLAQRRRIGRGIRRGVVQCGHFTEQREGGEQGERLVLGQLVPVHQVVASEVPPPTIEVDAVPGQPVAITDQATGRERLLQRWYGGLEQVGMVRTGGPDRHIEFQGRGRRKDSGERSCEVGGRRRFARYVDEVEAVGGDLKPDHIARAESPSTQVADRKHHKGVVVDVIDLYAAFAEAFGVERQYQQSDLGTVGQTSGVARE